MKRILFLMGLVSVMGVVSACASTAVTMPTAVPPTSAPQPTAALPSPEPTIGVSVPPTVPLNRTREPQVPPPIDGEATRPPETAMSDPTLESLIADARTDLEGRTAAASGEIRVKSTEEREWNDSSLGCPEPGMMYAQVITPGYLIVLEVNGQEFNYHASETSVKLCEN